MKKLTKLSSVRHYFARNGELVPMAEMRELSADDRDELGDACLAHYRENPGELPEGYSVL